MIIQAPFRAALMSALLLSPVASQDTEKDDSDKITIAIDHADIHDLISSIARSAKANIIISPDVKGTVTVDLVDVPWRKALETSVETLGYSLRESRGILRVMPASKSAPKPRVYFAFEKADVRKVIATIAKISGANIVVAPEVRGTITLQLRGVPWHDSLDAIAETLGFVLEDDARGIVRILAPERPQPAAEAPVTIAFEDADLRKVIETIAKLGGANIVLAPEVQGTISLRLVDVAWRDALDAAVRTLGYKIVEDKGILRICR